MSFGSVSVTAETYCLYRTYGATFGYSCKLKNDFRSVSNDLCLLYIGIYTQGNVRVNCWHRSTVETGGEDVRYDQLRNGKFLTLFVRFFVLF